MWPCTFATNHQAALLLDSYATQGCPADCRPNWSKKQIETALSHRPHRSATSPAARKALRNKAANKVQQGFAKIIQQYIDIKNNIPATTKISPAACIPNKSRQFRVILDLSFNLKLNRAYQASVNQSTIPHTPLVTMGQLESCLCCIIATMANNCDPKHPFCFSKLDIKDRFWRMVVSEDNAWNFCYVLQPQDGKPVPLDKTVIVVPDALQMGWCESPPFFCASSETARDVIHTLINSAVQLPPHKFEHFLMPERMETSTPDNPTLLIEVLVDDFIAITNKLELNHLTLLLRSMLHGIYSIFPPAEVTNHGGGDSIAEKKLNKEDGQWTTTKEILGWLFKGKKYTIQLLDDKVTKLIHRLKSVKAFKHKIPHKKLQQLAGSLEHASFGIPGGAGLFSPIQQALQGTAKWIKVTPNLTQCLLDWGAVVKYMAKHSTHVNQLVKKFPQYIGYSDSCGIGTGGVWTSGSHTIPPTLWHVEWLQDIKEAFAAGNLTMNDLKLAVMVLEWLVLEYLMRCLLHVHAAIFVITHQRSAGRTS